MLLFQLLEAFSFRKFHFQERKFVSSKNGIATLLKARNFQARKLVQLSSEVGKFLFQKRESFFQKLKNFFRCSQAYVSKAYRSEKHLF